MVTLRDCDLPTNIGNADRSKIVVFHDFDRLACGDLHVYHSNSKRKKHNVRHSEILSHIDGKNTWLDIEEDS